MYRYRLEVNALKYTVIVEFIKGEIFEGNIKPGKRMPSIRSLCEKFSCTKSTAVRAYYELKNQDIVYAVPNSGYYLIDKFHEKQKSNNGITDFSGTALETSILPYREFQACINQAIDKYKDKLFYYINPKGLDSLIKVLKKQLQNYQVFSEEENIFVTTGSQQSLNILSKMPFPNGKNNIAVEQPTYNGMLECIKQNNAVPIGICRNFKGLDFQELERVFRGGIKFFYTVSRFSNPLGLSYSDEDKKKLISLAEKYNTYIVEDDYLGDMERNNKSNPIYSFDTNSRVIYIKTFSKVMLPGLRVAVAVLPKGLIGTFFQYKKWLDINTPVLSQGALELYISSGMFNKHIKKTRNIYFKRMEYLKEVVQRNYSQVINWKIPDNGGFYAGLEILNGNKEKTILKRLLDKNIILSSFEKHYLDECLIDNMLSVSVASVSCEEIEEGIPKIVNEIENKTLSLLNFY